MIQSIGSYQVLNMLGAGSQATVYRVSRGSQVFALKLLHPSSARDHVSVQRFLREGHIASYIEHPNIVRIEEVGRLKDSYYIVMEFLPLTLQHLLEARKPIELNRALDIVRQLAKGLGAVWTKHIIHRDIEPTNILMTEDGRVKISDFGISRPVSLSHLTQEGIRLGTPLYMSPEQGQALPVDVRSDLYSLGIILYQMLTSRMPFYGRDPDEVVSKQLGGEFISIESLAPDISDGVVEIVNRLLQKDPDKRFQTPSELEEAIENLGLPAPEGPMIETVGKYALLNEVGRGSQGVVYRAVDLQTSTAVAVKILHPRFVESASGSGVIAQEVRLASELEHPNVVKTLDYGVANNQTFIVMEYLTWSLRQLMAERGKLELRPGLRICIEVCDALQRAYELGLAHLDVKPENILLTSSLQAKLADFGIARTVSALALRDRASGSLGTRRYMSPEQIRGENLDIRSDLYSVGLVLFEMLTGVHLEDVLEQENPGRQRPDNLAGIIGKYQEISTSVSAILQTVLAPVADDRYETPRDMRLDLESALDELTPPLARQTLVDSPARGVPLISKIRKSRWIGIAATILILSGSLGAFLAIRLWPSPLLSSEGQPVALVEVSPAALLLEAGASFALTATPRDEEGNALEGHQVAWSSSDDAVVAVDSNGIVRGGFEGRAELTAASGGRVGRVTVGVSSPSYGTWPMWRYDNRNTGRAPYFGPETPQVSWSVSLDGFPVQGMVIASDGTAYVATHHPAFLYSIARDGTVNWKIPVGGESDQPSPPVLGLDGTIYIGTQSEHKLYAIAPDGRVTCEFQGDYWLQFGPVVNSDGTIYVGSWAGDLYTVRPGTDSGCPTGEWKWTQQLTIDLQPVDTPVLSEDGTIYVSVGNYLSKFQGIMALHMDGSEKWSLDLNDECHPHLSVADDGTIYGACGGILYAVSPAGKLKWTFPTELWGAPTVGIDGRVYTTSTDRVYSINPDGTQNWRILIEPAIGRAPLVIDADGTIYIGVSGNIQALSPDGRLEWTAFVGDTVVFTAIGRDGYLYAVVEDSGGDSRLVKVEEARAR